MLVLEPLPDELQALLERRRRTGVDRRDEVWEGVYHMVPSPGAAHSLLVAQLAVLLAAYTRNSGLHTSVEFNLGVKDDFRIPDLGVHRERPHGTWIATAAIAVEILSPEDQTWDKLPFYARHDVEELLIVDPAHRSVHWLALCGGEYQQTGSSEILGLGAAQLAERIDWPRE